MPDFYASVEDFASLRASMDDPFGDPVLCLARAGLDASDYAALTNEWRARLAGDVTAGGGMGSRFAVAYRQALDARRARARGDAAQEEGARFLSREPQPWRAEAARVALLPTKGAPPPTSAPPPPPAAVESARAAPLSPVPSAAFHALGAPARGTDDAHLTPPLPPRMPSPPAVSPPAPHANDVAWPAIEASPQRRPAGHNDKQSETMTLPVYATEGSAPVLPFVTPPASGAAAPAPPRAPLAGLPFQPGPPERAASPTPPPAIPAHLAGAAPAQDSSAPSNKRLLRFDPQTGQPLPFPVWVDVAPADPGEKRG
ncbi:hypothetical protein WME91_23305 [Sorangium sp. So ce269]